MVNKVSIEVNAPFLHCYNVKKKLMLITCQANFVSKRWHFMNYQYYIVIIFLHIVSKRALWT